MKVRISRLGANAHEYTNPDHTYLSHRMASPFSRMSVIHDINSHLCRENKTCCVHTSRCRASLIQVLRKRPNLVCPFGNTSLCTGYWTFTRSSWITSIWNVLPAPSTPSKTMNGPLRGFLRSTTSSD